MMNAAEYFHFHWQKNKQNMVNDIVQETLKKFSIGNVMQIVCDSLEEKKENTEQ